MFHKGNRLILFKNIFIKDVYSFLHINLAVMFHKKTNGLLSYLNILIISKLGQQTLRHRQIKKGNRFVLKIYKG